MSKLLDAASFKVLEKVYDYAPPWGREAARASANCGAAVRAESSAATHRLCKTCLAPRLICCHLLGASSVGLIDHYTFVCELLRFRLHSHVVIPPRRNVRERFSMSLRASRKPRCRVRAS